MSSMKRLILLSALTLTVLLLGLAGEDDDVEPFTIVMLPDTQLYSQSFPDLFHGQTKWIRDQAKSQNIVFVSHVGDIVQNGDAAPEEWRVADAALSRLGGVVPWGVAIGNHDYDLDEPKGRGTAYLKYFGPKRFEKYDWYMGSSRNGLNSYQVFTAGRWQFLILHLETDVPDEAIQWVKQVIKENRRLPTIVATHIYLDDDTRSRTTDPFYQKDAGNSGEAIWKKLIQRQPQIFMVLCGHWAGEWHQVSYNDAGKEVFEILADYQTRRNGGDGWLRTMTFVPEASEIRVRTYSPSLHEYETDADSDFTLTFDMSKRFADP